MVYVALLAVEHGLGDRARRGTTLASTSGPVVSAAPPRTPPHAPYSSLPPTTTAHTAPYPWRRLCSDSSAGAAFAASDTYGAALGDRARRVLALPLPARGPRLDLRRRGGRRPLVHASRTAARAWPHRGAARNDLRLWASSASGSRDE